MEFVDLTFQSKNKRERYIIDNNKYMMSCLFISRKGVKRFIKKNYRGYLKDFKRKKKSKKTQSFRSLVEDHKMPTFLIPLNGSSKLTLSLSILIKIMLILGTEKSSDYNSESCEYLLTGTRKTKDDVTR